MRKNYERKERKSNHTFEVVRGQKLLVRVPLPMAEVWAEMQAKVEELTGQAALQILRAILENEVTRRVGSPHRPHPSAGWCAGGSIRAMQFLQDRKPRWNGRWFERAKARKWS